MGSRPSRRRLISSPGAGTRAADRRPELGPVRTRPALVATDARVGMQGLADELLGDVRAVGVGGVDEVDAELGQAPQHGAGALGVFGRAPDAGTGDAHRPEAEASDLDLAADLERA